MTTNSKKLEGLDYLWSLAPWQGKGEFSLDGIRKVLLALKNPQDKVKSIHVTGTNGKGSVCAMIASGLGQAGYRVGLNISPHLVHINERFIIDGKAVEDKWIDKYAQILKKACDAESILLSFHEAVTAISFIGFADSDLDYMVIEVGLGGRLDASNVINKPQVAVITSIGLDHQDILGQTLELITEEKSGIIKEGIKVVVGNLNNDCLRVVSRACEEKKASFINAFNTTSDLDLCLITQNLTLNGEHQVENAKTALQVLKLLNIESKDIASGLSNAFWPGRLEKTNFKNHQVLIDCAHNPDGIKALVKYLSQNSIAGVDLIFGSLNTKDWKQNLDILAPFVKSIAYLEPESIKSLSQSTIQEYLNGRLNVHTLNWEKENICNYFNMLKSNNLILLTGSIYMVGKLRSILDIPDRSIWIKK